jgi:hypothetical protein
VSRIIDRLVDELAALDDEVRAAGKVHLDGDPQRALAILDDVHLLLADVRADLRRELDPEPGLAP